MSASWRVIEGDCRDTLASLDAGSVQTCVTSPPYFGLRDYGHDGQIGLEPTPDEFVAALVGVFREVRRVLADDGTVWLNLGDSYNADGRKGRAHMGEGKNNGYSAWVNKTMDGTKPKDLLGIPWMVAFAIRADGWYLRSDIIWAKPNPMPESVTDRPTKAHEYLFLLSKGPRYFYDAEAIKEEGTNRAPGNVSHKGTEAYENGDEYHRTKGGLMAIGASETRNKRTVWTVPSAPFPGAHFATFPPKLIEPCILAGCPERMCGECGAPWERIVERQRQRQGASPRIDGRTDEAAGNSAVASLPASQRTDASRSGMGTPSVQTVGFAPSCGHDAPAVPGTVLDPFAGAGTTGMVALRHGRSFIGCELKPAYAQLARDRIIADSPLLNSHAEAAA